MPSLASGQTSVLDERPKPVFVSNRPEIGELWRGCLVGANERPAPALIQLWNVATVLSFFSLDTPSVNPWDLACPVL